MASADLLSNDYSDHTVLKLDTGVLKVIQLNVAQLGRFQIFPNDRVPEGFNWSSTLRTATILKQLAQQKPELTKLGQRLLAIVNDSSLSLEDKNSLIAFEANSLLDDLRKLGFSVKSFEMAPNRLFNPGVSPNLLRENPSAYVKAPAFVLEDTESFTNRMKAGFNVMLADGADLAVAQEVELGESDGIKFSHIHNSLVESYDSYDFISPVVKTSGTVCVTYFNKGTFQNVSDKYESSLAELKSKLKCFGESDVKTIVVALEHHNTEKVFTVINIHAEYSKANTEMPWKVLRELFETVPNLVVSGDFNLTLANKCYFTDVFTDFEGKYTILQTPEPVEVGNPTYDLILSN